MMFGELIVEKLPAVRLLRLRADLGDGGHRRAGGATRGPVRGASPVPGGKPSDR